MGRLHLFADRAVFVSDKAPGVKLGRLRENRLQGKDSVELSRFGLTVSKKRPVLTGRVCESKRSEGFTS